MSSGFKVIVTGEHELPDLGAPLFHDGVPIQWKQVPVLQFRRLPISSEQVEAIFATAFDWIVFTSPRAVSFWNELLLEEGMELPAETLVACIGETTAEVASQDGYTPDFYPSVPGSERFLIEFKEVLQSRTEKPIRILIPQALNGRTLLREGLEAMGCEVVTLPLYESVPRENVRQLLTDAEIESSSLILFTSPSSFDAFCHQFVLPKNVHVGAIGTFTFEHLKKQNLKPKLLPEGDFANVGEILC